MLGRNHTPRVSHACTSSARERINIANLKSRVCDGHRVDFTHIYLGIVHVSLHAQCATALGSLGSRHVYANGTREHVHYVIPPPLKRFNTPSARSLHLHWGGISILSNYISIPSSWLVANVRGRCFLERPRGVEPGQEKREAPDICFYLARSSSLKSTPIIPKVSEHFIVGNIEVLSHCGRVPPLPRTWLQ